MQGRENVSHKFRKIIFRIWLLLEENTLKENTLHRPGSTSCLKSSEAAEFQVVQNKLIAT